MLDMLRLGGEAFILPSAPPALLNVLTDHVLVVASDAIRAVASSEKDEPVSGRDQDRLLAWVVADARGASEALDKALALTVGKRLDRQAAKVRNECASVAASAARARGHARKLALEDAALAATLEADLDASREVERGELEKPVSEVYVGFHELESLLIPRAPPAPCTHDDDETDELQEPKKRRLNICDFTDFLRAEGIKFPNRMYELHDRESHAIPPDLGKALGPDATQALWAQLEHLQLNSESWWTCGLPLYTQQLLKEKVRDDGYHAEDIEASEAREKEAREDAARQREEDISTISALEDELEELRGQLREAKGREDALHGVIDRCRWG